MEDNMHNQPNAALLIELVKMKMPFGKYKGTVLSNIPVTYLEWFKNKGFPTVIPYQNMILCNKK